MNVSMDMCVGVSYTCRRRDKARSEKGGGDGLDLLRFFFFFFRFLLTLFEVFFYSWRNMIKWKTYLGRHPPPTQKSSARAPAPNTKERKMSMTARGGMVSTHAGRRVNLHTPTSPAPPPPPSSVVSGRVLRRPHHRPFPKKSFAGTATAMMGATNPEEDEEEEDAALDLAAELDALVEETRASGAGASLHVVAFSGGVDSSLAAYLVQRAFGSPDDDDDDDDDVPGDTGDSRIIRTPGNPNPNDITAPGDDDDDVGRLAAVGIRGAAAAEVGTGARGCVAAIGVSPALPTWQLDNAREVADTIGIALWEVPTDEGAVPEYVANEVRERERGRESERVPCPPFIRCIPIYSFRLLSPFTLTFDSPFCVLPPPHETSLRISFLLRRVRGQKNKKGFYSFFSPVNPKITCTRVTLRRG